MAWTSPQCALLPRHIHTASYSSMYQRSITRLSRSAIVIAIDSSISMQEWTLFYNTRMRKMEAAALIANFTIDELTLRSTRAGNTRDYYDICVLQYSGDGVDSIIASEDGSMQHINQLYEIMPQPVCYNITHSEEDGTQSSIPISLHEWVKPKAYDTAPMYETFSHIKSLLTKWCDDHFNSDSFPPIVIHISAGCCSDADEAELQDIVNDIQIIGTNDGTTLLVNIYLANEDDGYDSTIFPPVCDLFSDDNDCQMLYNISSVLPAELEHSVAEIVGRNNRRGYKCFARNASICEILTLADIGTESVNNRI